MENVNQPPSDAWPEKFPGLADFVNKTTPSTSTPPYAKAFTPEDNTYMKELASLTPTGLVAKVKELHDMAFQLELEENKELNRGHYLNILSKGKKSQ